MVVRANRARDYRRVFGEGRVVDMVEMLLGDLERDIKLPPEAKVDFGFCAPLDEVRKLSPEDQWRSIDSPVTLCSLVWMLTDDPVSVLDSSVAASLSCCDFSGIPGSKIWEVGPQVIRRGKMAEDDGYVMLSEADQEVDAYMLKFSASEEMQKSTEELKICAKVVATFSVSSAMKEIHSWGLTGNRKHLKGFLEKLANSNFSSCMSTLENFGRQLSPEETKKYNESRTALFASAARAAALATPASYIRRVIQSKPVMVSGGDA